MSPRVTAGCPTRGVRAERGWRVPQIQNMEDVELAGGGRGWRESEGTAWGGKLVNEDRSSFTADWNPKRKQVLPHQQIKRRYTVKPSGSGKKQTHTVDQTHTLTRECCLSRDICYQTIEIAYAQRPIHTQSQTLSRNVCMQIKRDVLPKEPAGFPAEDKTGDRVEKLGWDPALTLRQCVTV